MTYTPVASDFELTYDKDHTFPFLETEDGDYFAWGFQDPQDFINSIREYDIFVGIEDDIEDEEYDSYLKYVHHTFAKMTEDSVDGEWRFQYGEKYKDDPEAFKLTVFVR